MTNEKLRRIRELERRENELLVELGDVRRQLERRYKETCTCSGWRLSTFYGQHSKACPLVAASPDAL